MNIPNKIRSFNYYQLSATFGIIGQALIFICELIVARFLGPSEFGKFALFILIVELIQIISMKSFALTCSINKELSKSSLFKLLVSSICLSFIVFEFVIIICKYFNLDFFEGTSRLFFYLVVCLCLIDYFAKIHFLKDGKFNFVSTVDLLSVAIFVVCLLFFIQFNLDWHSFVYAYVARFLFKAILYTKQWRITDDSNARSILITDINFSCGLTLQSIFLFSTNNIDKFIISKTLDVTSLGIYSRAQKLIYTPFEQVIRSVSNISFSRMNNENLDGKCCILKNTLCLIFFTTLPSVFFIMFNADFIVTTIYGDKWITMVDILPQIAVIACLSLLSIPMGDFLKSNGVIYKELFTNIVMSSLIVIYSIVNFDTITLSKFANFLIVIGALILLAQTWQVSTVVSLKKAFSGLATVSRLWLILLLFLVSYISSLFNGLEMLGAITVALLTVFSFIHESGNLKKS
jgi:O-antigen/teichoic acid export membrane protein